MKNEIKVGEYCRTTEGYIGKYIKDTSVKGVVEIKDNEMIFPTRKHNIVKHSSILINLIQCGDYVNGIRVKQWFKGVYTKGIELENGYKIDTVNSLGKIKTVVTKEMMESISYKVTKM